MPVGLERNSLAKAELQHGRVGSHLLKKFQASDYPVVQVDQFWLCQFVNVNRHKGDSSLVRRIQRQLGLLC